MEKLTNTMKKILLILISLISLQVQAQDYAFRVIATSGVITTLQGAKIKTGTKLNTDEKVVLPTNAYLGLVAKNGKTIELKNAGTYAIKDLSAKLVAYNRPKSTLTHKYADYVVNEMAKVNRDDINKNHRKYMSVTGAVERGEGIDLFLPLTSDIYQAKANIKWPTFPNTKTYEVKVMNMYSKVLTTYATQDTTFTLDLSKSELNKENTLIVKVSSKDTPSLESKTYALKRLTSQKTALIDKELKDVQVDTEETSAVDKLVQAAYFEEKKLLVDAIRCYEEALALQPGVEDYQAAYTEFLLRNKILKEVVK